MFTLTLSYELRRVPDDFDWPLGEVWAGYQRPRVPCEDCERTGLTAAARAAGADLLDPAWQPNPTAEELSALRLHWGAPADHADAWAWLRDPANRVGLLSARCHALGVPCLCASCEGEGDRADRLDPPAGGAWQLWETITDGSPISPPFADSPGSVEALAAWCAEHLCHPLAPRTDRDWLRVFDGLYQTIDTETGRLR